VRDRQCLGHHGREVDERQTAENGAGFSERVQWAWGGRASWEHPVDPSHYRFGAEVFDVNGGDDGRAVIDHGTSTLSGDSVDGSSGSGYLDRGTQSLTDVALATTGQGDLVSRPERFIPRMSTREDLP